MVFANKEKAMVQQCNILSSEIGKLEIINKSNVAEVISRNENDNVIRLIVTKANGEVIYDSVNPTSVQTQYVLLPEIVKSLGGYNVFSSVYQYGAIQSKVATPVYSYGTMVGSVYIMETDARQGALIANLQETTLIISIVLELVVVVFSMIFSHIYSSRLHKISMSMRSVREGNYSHGVTIGGNDELTVLGAEYNDLVAKLQVSEQKRNNFVSDASHELKTPLASIKLLSDSILQYDMDMESVREFVGDIGNEADRLNRMTQKLLSLSRIEGQVDSDCEIIYMAPTVERVIRMLDRLAESHETLIISDLSDDCTILILEDDLYQIVFNLVENAIKYNISGGKVFITLRREKDNAVLQIRDTGMGIPKESLEHIFERFYRVDKARARKSGGSGLGLSIVRNMVERNQGTIKVESTVGAGTTFTLVFPVFDTEEQA